MCRKLLSFSKISLFFFLDKVGFINISDYLHKNSSNQFGNSSFSLVNGERHGERPTSVKRGGRTATCDVNGNASFNDRRL